VRLHWHRGRARPLPRRRGRGEPRQISHVAGFKGSRLACSRRDWCQLLEICTFAGTLIAGSGVYDPTLLALKGTISEAELHIMWARLGEGRWNKACRGELRLNMPRDHPKHSQGEVLLALTNACEALRLTKHGIHRMMVGEWKRQAVEGMAGVFSGKPAVQESAKTSGAEVEKLHAKVGQLLVARDS
jgi:DNA invertase Pin-like site-specific DNA recombinase